jgi:hypothetical protein
VIAKNTLSDKATEEYSLLNEEIRQIKRLLANKFTVIDDYSKEIIKELKTSKSNDSRL